MAIGKSAAPRRAVEGGALVDEAGDAHQIDEDRPVFGFEPGESGRAEWLGRLPACG
jgi:hypothetical protein